MTVTRRAHLLPVVQPSASSRERATDQQLISQVLDGQGAAFDALVERHAAPLIRFLRFTLRWRPDDAEDVAQETLLEAYRGLKRFEGRSSFRTWLYGIARNVCRHRRSTCDFADAFQPDESVLLNLPETHPTPLDELERSELQARVRRGIDELRPGLRAVIFLRDIEELSYQEIAEILELPIGTVRSRIHNARLHLARRLMKSPEGEPS